MTATIIVGIIEENNENNLEKLLAISAFAISFRIFVAASWDKENIRVITIIDSFKTSTALLSIIGNIDDGFNRQSQYDILNKLSNLVCLSNN